MICGQCDKTDGNIYTSLPPMVYCTVRKEYHFLTDECVADEAPNDFNALEYHFDMLKGNDDDGLIG